MSHSKRNTSRPVFTAHERALAKSNWTSSSARLNRDSFLPFGSCGLCLGSARDPVSCQHGDIFCRECALANILAQKKELKRAEKMRQEAELEMARIKELEDDEDRARAIRDFESTQAGISAGSVHSKAPSASRPEREAPKSNETVSEDSSQALVKVGSKRKFTLDGEDLSRIAEEDRAKARKAIDEEKAAKATLPSFWTPSLTPDVHDSKLLPVTKKGKSVPVCPNSPENSPHALTMQKLVTLQFFEDEAEDRSTQEKRRCCPSCRKVLNNSSSPTMARTCGHVFCMKCVKQFLIPSSKQASSEPDMPIMCYVCDSVLGSASSVAGTSGFVLPKGLVQLKSEGTGFSARGTSTIEKSGVGFQC